MAAAQIPIKLFRARARAATLCLAILIASLTGCGETGNTAGAGTPATPGTPPPPPGALDTLAKIKAAGVLKWGSDSEGGAPYVYHDEKDTNKIIGFEMDFMEAFCKRMGVKPERVQGDWGALIDGLKSHRSDVVVNGIEINDERKKVVAFSEPYFVYEQQLTVRAEDKDKVKTLADLKGHKIGVLGDTEAQHVLERAGFTPDQIAKYEDSQTPYQDLEIKRTDAVVQESIIAAAYAAQKADLYNVPTLFAPGKYGIVVRLEDTTLLAEANRILAEMKSSGELAAIYAKWHILSDKQKEVGVVAAK